MAWSGLAGRGSAGVGFTSFVVELFELDSLKSNTVCAGLRCSPDWLLLVVAAAAAAAATAAADALLAKLRSKLLLCFVECLPLDLPVFSLVTRCTAA